MRKTLLGGAALIAFIPALAFAQTTPAGQSDIDAPLTSSDAVDTPIDTLVDPDASQAKVKASASTGDPVLDRLNALAARVELLEKRNAELEQQAAATEERIAAGEVRNAKAVQTGTVVPTFADVGDNFTFKPRGVFELDYAGYNERAGGYDYNNGTSIRRGRFGFDGTAFKVFKWRFEAEFVGQSTNILDAYVQYQPRKDWVLTFGQHKAPAGLEANSSDNYNEFLERGMANTAFGSLGAERRIGISASYVSDKLNAQLGVFGSPESVTRASSTDPDEGYGVNGRITWEPILDTGKMLHLGASGWRVTNLASSTSTNAVTGVVTNLPHGARLSDRPNSRVDGGLIADSGLIPNVKNATFYGLEAAGIWGPFSVQGEYSHLRLNRSGGFDDVSFDGFYVFGSVFLTGESRVFKNGVIDRVKPTTNFSSKGWGAFELALRYDELDLSNTPIGSRAGNQAHTWTGALNWYLNGNTKVMFNYIRAFGDNTALDPVGDRTKADIFATRLHFDF
jgi:phosphate-selective porin OprO/OprP